MKRSYQSYWNDISSVITFVTNWTASVLEGNYFDNSALQSGYIMVR